MGIDLDRMRTVVQRAPGPPRGLVAAVGIGVAFGLGAVVGGGDARALGRDDFPGQGRVEDALVVATGRADALEETRAKLKLTYGTELSKPDAPEPRRVLAKASATVTTTAATTTAKKEEAAEPIEPPPAPAIDEPAPAARVAARDDAADAGLAEDVSKRSGDDLKAAIARVVADEKPAAKFALQVAAAPTQAGADEVVKKLAAASHSARIVEGQVGGKPVFRVRVGGFADRAAADAYKAKLALPAFIVNE